jgi:sarcosine oxidase subunit beta
MSTAVPASASVVVIGGGVIGASVLFHLAEAGVTDAVLVERGALAGGSTVRSAGGVRAQFSDELNVRIGARSLRAFEDFGRRPGWEIDLHQVGYLFLLDSEEAMAQFTSGVVLQRSLGVPSELLSPAEAVALSPYASPDGLLGAAWSADDGHCTPEAVVQGYAAGARGLGARVCTGAEVVGVDVVGGAIRAVRTTAGDIATDVVVCCAGAWSRAVGAMAGVELPITPYRRQIIVTEPVPGGVRRDIPMTIDFSSSFYFHREGPGLLMGMSWPGEQPGFSTETHDDWVPDLSAAIERRAPALKDLGVQTQWAGLYEVTPDHNALLGEAGGVSRFLYASGFSGHGFLQAPGVGEILRDLVLERDPFVDVSSLSVDRFASEALRPELNIV